MKSFFICFLSLFFFLNCSSQKKSDKTVLKESSGFQSASELTGKWYKTQYFILQNDTKKNLMDACLQKSFWEFSSDKGNTFFNKVTQSGANCKLRSVQNFNNITIFNGKLQYLDHDVLQSIALEKISEKSFKISETTLIQGKTAEVVTVFFKR